MDPLDYECFSHLMKQSYLLITDSGGIQEEAPTLGIPVLVVRESTERTEGVEAGTLRVVGTDESEIVKNVTLLLQDQEEYTRMAKSQNPYGDGSASKKIAAFLKNYFQLD
jgi:UDP-N-acetylglucosamine 2-epimerase (non-hydrolysing)